jgi:hypothetical protein
MAVMVAMTTGVETTIDVATIARTIGGDEFHSLGNNLHLTSAGNLPVYPAKGLGSNAGAFLVYLLNPANPVILPKN